MVEQPVRRPSLDDLKLFARAAQLGLEDADLERLYPQIVGQLLAVSRLSEVDLGEIEPATIFQPGGAR